MSPVQKFKPMKEHAILILFKLVASTQVDNCEWLGGYKGVELECLPGYYMNGVCGTAMYPNCGATFSLKNRYFYQIKCCPTKKATSTQQNCIYEGGASGEKALCPINNDGQQTGAYGGCGSGRRAECKSSGEKKYTDTLCCVNEGMEIDNTMCSWRYGRFGEQISCPANYIITGQCGSGTRAECAKNEHTGIKCCPFVESNSAKTVPTTGCIC